MPNDRLPKKLLFGQVKGSCPSGGARLSCDDVASSDCHECCITRPYNRFGETRLVLHIPSSLELECVLTIVIIMQGKMLGVMRMCIETASGEWELKQPNAGHSYAGNLYGKLTV